MDPVWSPDNQFLVYATAQKGTTFFLKAVTVDGKPHPLPDIALSLGSKHFSFVPGTTSVAFLDGGFWDKNIWVVDLLTHQRRQLTNLSREWIINDFDVSPDRQQIVFSRRRENSDVVLIERPESL